MKSFKDFGINQAERGLKGDKLKIERILNREIIVEKYIIQDSNLKPGTKCLHMQFSVSGNQHVLFSGSQNLMETIERIPKTEFPFKTTIIKANQRFEFS